MFRTIRCTTVLQRLFTSRVSSFKYKNFSGRLPFLLVKIMSGAGVLLGITIGSCSLNGLKAAEKPFEQHRNGNSKIDVVATADRLYDANEMEDGLKFLEQYSDSSDAEILWRLARLTYKVGKFHTAEDNQLEMAEKAVRYGERALEADPDNFACHKWMGVIISWSSGFYGTKRKIERSFDIQEHFVRAIELNPKDPTSRHLLGQWCYNVSHVPWYQKKIATVVFATPPYSTYEEALAHFQAAEALEPGFYSTNWLFIGKCYLQLGKVQEGGVWLKKAAAYNSDVEEDNEAKREAIDLLKKLGISQD